MNISRRSFITGAGISTAASILPARWANARDVNGEREIKLRFAIASDLHYGQRNTPFDEFAENMVEWINAEKKDKGLDLFFINGDITHDEPGMLIQLRDKHLKNLDLPYYSIKGCLLYTSDAADE